MDNLKAPEFVSIPKIIHQLWKDQHVPQRYQPLAETWKRHHPDWTYRLWTDADIRALVEAEYPDFLPIFDGYKDPICRADAGRYLILRSQGGIYADLDLECLRPIDALLTKPQLYIAKEPHGHLGAANVQAGGFDKLLCPTFIACPPMHPFWDHFLLALVGASNEIDPLDATGPFVMTRAFDAFERTDSIELLASNTFYPFTKDECWDGQIFDIEYWEQATQQAYGVHYWDGSWFRNSGKPLAPFPEKLSGRIVQGAASSPATTLRGDELVSCILLLAERTELTGLSIDMFRSQTYGPRELLVIDRQGREDAARDIARLNDPRIRIIRPTENQKSLSHIVAEEARGTHVCLWTDAALSDPNRLAIQMAAIKTASTRACMLERILIWHPAQRRLAVSRQGIWVSSFVCEKSIFPTEAQRAEGLGAWRQHYGAILLDLPRLHMRCISLLNPSPMEPIWAQTKPPYDGARYDSVLTELAKTLPVRAYGEILEQAPRAAILAKKPSARPLGFNIFGHFSAGIGLGVAGRGDVAAIEATGLPYTTFDLDDLAIPGRPGGPVDLDTIAPYAINIFHTNPDAMTRAMWRGRACGFTDEIFEGRYNIGRWAWESATTLPPKWLPWLHRFDEIWVPSHFVAHCLAPYAVNPVIDIPISQRAEVAKQSRADLNLPADRFVFLFMFDELSGFNRKNPLGLIEAYHRAFPKEDGRTTLVVKARTLSQANYEILQNCARGRASIQFRIGEVCGDTNSSLIAHCDAYVSLHRSEGYGLTIAEAMAAGKPVITTGYSGNLDFTLPNNSYLVSYRMQRLEADQESYSAGTEWADPDLDHAAHLMRRVVENPQEALEMGRRASQFIAQNLNPQKIAARIERRLQTIIDAKSNLAFDQAPRRRSPRLSADAARVLVLTPVKNASRYLPRYFELLSRLDYNPDLMSLGMLEGDSDDTTYDDITARLPDLRWRMRKVTLVKQDFGQRIDGPRWAANVQLRRRETLARVRNRLLSETLRDEDWVLWLDVDLIDYPPELLRRLMASGKDIVVPRCDLPNGRDYDLNSFRFDPAKGPAEDPRYLIDGIYQPKAGQGRAYLSELPGGKPVQINCVGGTALLIRADLHREGLIFPAYSHRGYIETEGLAMMAKDMGHSCWALPDLQIVHAPD